MYRSSYKKLALFENGGFYNDHHAQNKKTVGGNWYGFIDFWEEVPNETAEKEIASIGYSVDEVIRIEKAFESATYGNGGDEFMFNGLMAVLEVLADIHGVELSGKSVYELQLQEIHATK